MVGIVLLREDGAALLQLRDNIPPIADPNVWVMPGGHVESGETAEEAAVSEFEEETGYRCLQVHPLLNLHGRELGYDEDFILTFFWGNYDAKQHVECREGRALRFVSRDQIEKLPRRDYLTRVWDSALAARARKNASK